MTPKEIVKECTDNGTHLNSCDDDGFCNHCGHQFDTPQYIKNGLDVDTLNILE